MTEPATPTPAAIEAAPTDWARLLLDQQIALLGELAEAGMDMVRAMRVQAKAIIAPDDAREAATESTDAPDAERLFLGYSRVSRAVRLTLMLQAELIRQVQALDEGSPAEPAALREQKARIHRIVLRQGEREHRGTSFERLSATRLDRDFCGDILASPISEIIAMICKDLGLTPDWPRLAQETWAREEMANDDVGWPLARFVEQAGSSGSPPPEPPPRSPLAPRGRRCQRS